MQNEDIRRQNLHVVLLTKTRSLSYIPPHLPVWTDMPHLPFELALMLVKLRTELLQFARNLSDKKSNNCMVTKEKT